MKCDKKTMLLYAVTDRAWVGRQSLYEQVECALKGGATCVQVREKKLGDEDFLEEAKQIAALCKRYGVPLFINDNVDVAIACGAEGVHVGQEDMAAAKVREKAVAYDDLFAGARSKSELVATFLAVLELVKGKRIRVDGDGAGTTVRLIRDREGKSGGD